MAHALPFSQVDVFSPSPFQGNPVAVIHGAEELSTEQMQQIARWTNLSETTFLLPPTDVGADYRLRIFTPAGELPFAGHPTLGSAHAWLEAGGTPRSADAVVQESGAGLVRLRRTGDQLAFAAPPCVRTGALDEETADAAAAALRIPRAAIIAHQWVDNGPGWAAVQLASAEAVLALEPDFTAYPTAMLGVIGPYPAASAHAFEIRAFAPGVGVAEDPVTGSLNASVAQWFAASGQAPGSRYTVSQGTRLGRRGVVEVSLDGDEVWIGGATAIRVRGTITA